jgi:hypothetical protein
MDTNQGRSQWTQATGITARDCAIDLQKNRKRTGYLIETHISVIYTTGLSITMAYLALCLAAPWHTCCFYITT